MIVHFYVLLRENTTILNNLKWEIKKDHSSLISMMLKWLFSGFSAQFIVYF